MSDRYEALAKVIAESLDDSLLCTRVWEAWSFGTMTDEDFTRAQDDPEFVAQVATAVVEFLLNGDAIERVAKVMAEVTGEPRVGRFERTMSRAVLLAALGVTE